MNFSLAFWLVIGSLFGAPAVAILFAFLAVRHIPNNCVGVIEKLWSAAGSLDEGQLVGTLLKLITAEKIGQLDLERAEKLVNESEPTA